MAEKRAVWRASGVARQDRVEVLGEAHVEHLVGLVEHDDRHVVEPQAAPVEVIDRPARRRDDDVDPAAQAAQLLADRLAAVDRHDPDAERLAVGVERLGDLHRKLPRRDEDERRRAARPRLPDGDPAEDREGERRRLAGPRRGLGEDVATGRQERDGLALDRRRFLVAEVGEGREQPIVDPERSEPVRRGVSGGCRLVGRVGGLGRGGMRVVRRRHRLGRGRVRRGRVRGRVRQHRVGRRRCSGRLLRSWHARPLWATEVPANGRGVPANGRGVPADGRTPDQATMRSPAGASKRWIPLRRSSAVTGCPSSSGRSASTRATMVEPPAVELDEGIGADRLHQADDRRERRPAGRRVGGMDEDVLGAHPERDLAATIRP